MPPLFVSMIIGFVSVGILAYSFAPYYFVRLISRITTPVPAESLNEYQSEIDEICRNHKFDRVVLKLNQDYKPSTVLLLSPSIYLSPMFFTSYTKEERNFLLVRALIRNARLFNLILRNHFRIWPTYYALVGLYIAFTFESERVNTSLIFAVGFIIQILPIFLLSKSYNLFDDDPSEDEKTAINLTQDSESAISAIQKEFADIAELGQPHLRMASTRLLDARIDVLQAQGK